MSKLSSARAAARTKGNAGDTIGRAVVVGTTGDAGLANVVQLAGAIAERDHGHVYAVGAPPFPIQLGSTRSESGWSGRQNAA